MTVLSSDYEGLPTVIIESLALGTPVVSTDCPSGPREILKGDLSRFLVPVEDEQALATMIRDAVAEAEKGDIHIDPAVLEPFRPDRVADQYLALADRRRRPGLE